LSNVGDTCQPGLVDASNPADFDAIYQKLVLCVSSGVPNTEKQMRPHAFIVLRCLEPLLKHEARVFDMTSQMNQ